MQFEASIARHNADYFLREFTYSAPRFRHEKGESELCDGAIWIDHLLILLQMKERAPRYDSHSPSTETKWFQKKVSRAAVSQLSSSLAQLESRGSLPLTNLRGQVLDVSQARPSVVHKIVLYSGSDSLPPQVTCLKGRISDRIGFVHFLSVGDYLGMCQTLHTPFEIADYLSFRQDICTTNTIADSITEKALVGKYLSDTDPEDLSQTYDQFVDRLIDDRAEFSVGELFRNYLDRVVWGNVGTQYHAILVELAKLRRNTLREFRKRLLWAMDRSKEQSAPLPSRFFCPALGCSYIVIPLARHEREKWRTAIESYTTLCKYDFRSQKAIGVTVALDIESSNDYLVNWLLLDGEWQYDAEIERFLSSGSPFRATRGAELGKYNFSD